MVNTIACLEIGIKEKEQEEMLNAHHPPVSIQKKIPWLQRAPTNDPEPPMDPETISTESSPTDEHDMYSPSASNADDDSNLMESAPTPATKLQFRDRVNMIYKEQREGNKQERDGHKRKLSTGLA
ncbi:hypothetical protein H0H87_000763 [Tephrocybe sp. NHM501043]|nr:hypothetical protein H0H87_000763 [Tephrocybe sp. NHM501043]